MKKVKSSIYKGVAWCEADHRWRVHIFFNGRQHGLGNFKTEEEAHDLYVKVTAIIHPDEKIKNIKGEKWKTIELFGNNYAVSNKGRIKSFNYRNTGRERLLKSFMTRYGYYKTTINNKAFFVHVLVAKCFLGIKEIEGLRVNHIDGNRSNNCVENLEYISNRANVCHGLMTSNRKDRPIGSHQRKRDGRYVTEIKIGDKRIWYGSYDTAQEASEKYIEALKEHGFLDDYDYIKRLSQNMK